MRKLIIIILSLFSISVSAQKLSYITVDTTTYNQYLRQEWPQLIESGKNAVENNINYFYLQMRMAYAYYSMKKYRKAIVHYKQALIFNSKDPVANLYLYYSYLNAGEDANALIQRKNLSDAQKVTMGIIDSVKITSYGIFYTHSFASHTLSASELTSNMEYAVNGIQKVSNSMLQPSAHLSHRMGNHVVLSHDIKYLRKNEMSYVVTDNISYLSEEQYLQQFEYAFNLQINPIEGLQITPGIHYARVSVPLFNTSQYGSGFGIERTTLSSLVMKNWLFKLKVRKQFSYFDLGLSYVYHTIGGQSTNQVGMHTAIFPFANLNAYYTLDAYYQLTPRSNGFTLSHSLGFKMHKNLWLEFSAKYPESMYLYDVNGNILYNNPEILESSFGSTLIIPIYKNKAKLWIGYYYNRYNSYFFPDDQTIEPFNSYTYTNHILNGGILWTL